MTGQKISIKGFVETSFVDWPGKVCSVIFFPFCNFRCAYCHNADLVLNPDAFEDIEYDTVFERLSGLKGWVDGVCVSGGEPTLHPELPRVLSSLKEKGFLTKLDTNGSNPGVLSLLMNQGLVDYIAMDVKSCLDETSYCRVSGSSGILNDVNKSIQMLIRGNIQYEFRITVVPRFHTSADVFRLARQLKGARMLRLQNFSPSPAVLDRCFQNEPPFPEEELMVMQQNVDQLIAA